LVIWQLAGELVRATYRIAAQLPPDERYVAIPQIRRAAWSVQNNIAEGNARRGPGELRRFLDIALGSLGEIDSMLATRSSMYKLDEKTLEVVELLRRRLTAGIFHLRRHGRG
jgi:four helix bundle protein